jgi:ribulose-phosphate 3-epimerase
VEQAGADIIHVDVMDGHFVPNITIGIPVVASLRKATRLPLDVHLMIEQPEEYIEEFVHAGATRVLVHQEATVHLDRALAMIREHGAEAGAVIERGSGQVGHRAGHVGEPGVRWAKIYSRRFGENSATQSVALAI